MNDVMGGLGSAIEGALVSKAVEPGHGDSDSATHEAASCANCGTVGSSPYCGECGQKRHVHRSLSAIGHDLMHGVLHLDGKLWNTLPLLTFKPGQLTRRYIAGERAKFVSPMAMFLFTVFAMFAVFQMVGIGFSSDIPNELTVAERAANLRQQAEEEAKELRSELAQMPSDDPERSKKELQLAELDTTLANLDQIKLLAFGQTGSEPISFEGTGISWIDEGLIKKWRENPGLMLYKLQANAYKFSWLLIPLSIPFVWLTFAWRRQFKAYDHAIFVTYSLSFMSLLFIAMSLLGLVPGGSGYAFLLFAIGGPLHIYKHLRYTYDLSRFSTLWRFFALLIFINIVILLFLQALLLLGAF